MALLLWVAYQVYAPKLIGKPTTLSPLIELPDRVRDLEQTQEKLRSRVEEFNKMQVHHIQVTRANARALDAEKTQMTVDSSTVDEYLVDNGVPVDSLMHDDTTDENT